MMKKGVRWNENNWEGQWVREIGCGSCTVSTTEQAPKHGLGRNAGLMTEPAHWQISHF